MVVVNEGNKFFFTEVYHPNGKLNKFYPWDKNDKYLAILSFTIAYNEHYAITTIVRDDHSIVIYTQWLGSNIPPNRYDISVDLTEMRESPLFVHTYFGKSVRCTKIVICYTNKLVQIKVSKEGDITDIIRYNTRIEKRVDNNIIVTTIRSADECITRSWTHDYKVQYSHHYPRTYDHIRVNDENQLCVNQKAIADNVMKVLYKNDVIYLTTDGQLLAYDVDARETRLLKNRVRDFSDNEYYNKINVINHNNIVSTIGITNMCTLSVLSCLLKYLTRARFIHHLTDARFSS